ncbi:tRNA (adenosine(37)-N6)-dimethylallyltransferase MiaA [soil metagenome]
MPLAVGTLLRPYEFNIPGKLPPMSLSNFVVAVIGPTAAGKSDLAVAMAHELGAEIINVDSMQIYRGMDIGTAKLSVAEREGIPHHLLDILEVTRPATVAEFQVWARDAIADCQARGVLPILVGGSALYIRAVLDVFDFPGTDPAVRARLESELESVGSAAMWERLAAADPAAAAQILPGNGRRIVRALEVIELTGEVYGSKLPPYVFAYDNVVVIGLAVPRPELNERLAMRVDRMWEAGLVDEVRALEAAGLREGRTASRALGYAQVLDFLAGDLTEDEAREATVIGTRKFARRQDRWFKVDPRIHWLPYDSPTLLADALALLPR